MKTKLFRTLEYPIIRTPEEPQQAKGVARTILAASALTALFATLLAALLMIKTAAPPFDVSLQPPSVSATESAVTDTVEPIFRETVSDASRYEVISSRLD